jgi:hypothetical protein
MWHQFGRIPSGSEGVYMQITDIPDDWLNNHPSSSILPDPYGLFDKRNAHTLPLSTAAQRADAVGMSKDPLLSGYRLPRDLRGELRSEGDVTNRPKSLIDICGFPTTPKRIGDIRNRKKVFEAVVAVPFREINGERRFFSIQSPGSALFNSTGINVKKQIEKMEKYVFPPAFDFVQNPEVDPIAMYIFEFSHTFSKNDLSHMWQNLPPKIGTRFRKVRSTIRHPLLHKQLLKNNMGRAIEADRGERSQRIDFPEKLKWMVFKVKQRAKKDYFEEIGRDGVGIPFYTENWPYDFFSIIELAKIKSSVTFKRPLSNRFRSLTATSPEEPILPEEPEINFQDDRSTGPDPDYVPRDTTDALARPVNFQDDRTAGPDPDYVSRDTTGALTRPEGD